MERPRYEYDPPDESDVNGDPFLLGRKAASAGEPPIPPTDFRGSAETVKDAKELWELGWREWCSEHVFRPKATPPDPKDALRRRQSAAMRKYNSARKARQIESNRRRAQRMVENQINKS